MSAILDTLKKLEEEKSVMDQGVNLKDRLVRDEQPSDAASSTATRSTPLIVMALLILAAIAAGFGIGELLNRDKALKASAVVNKSQTGETGAATGAVRVQPQADHLGVPLSIIPEARETAGLMEEEDLYNARRIQAGVTSDGFEENIAPGAGSVLEEEAGVDFLASANLEKVNRAEPVAVSSEPPLNARKIPGLKITGIIYFSTANPSNYILASSPDQPSRKLKEGETAQGAELVKINKDSAVFLYNNQRTRLALGE